MTQISHTAPAGASTAQAATARDTTAPGTGSQDASAQAPTARALPVAEPFNVLDKVGMGILGLLTLSGLWMMLAPFLVDFQARGDAWTAGTTNDFVVGLVLAVLSFGALVAVLAGGLAGIARRARDRAASEG